VSGSPIKADSPPASRGPGIAAMEEEEEAGRGGKGYAHSGWLSNSELVLRRESCRHNCWSGLIAVAIFGLVAVWPPIEGLAHLQGVSVWIAICSALMGGSMFWASTADDDNLSRHMQLAEICQLATRLLMHGICVAYDGGPTFHFLKVMAIFVLPFDSAFQCNSLKIFRVYIAVQTTLVLIRFGSNLEYGAPWMVCSLMFAKMLVEMMTYKHQRALARDDLARENVKLAEDMTKKMYNQFCDATVALDADLKITDPAPRLAAVLGHQGKNFQDRVFCSLIEHEDLQSIQDYLRHDVDSRYASSARSRSIRVGFLDTFGQSVPLHVFAERFIDLNGVPTYIVGVLETWRGPKSKSHKSEKGKPAGSGTAPSVTLGSLLLEKADKPEDEAMASMLRQRAPQRGDSPRPSGKRGSSPRR